MQVVSAPVSHTAFFSSLIPLNYCNIFIHFIAVSKKYLSLWPKIVRYGKIYQSFHWCRFQENLRTRAVETSTTRLPQQPVWGREAHHQPDIPRQRAACSVWGRQVADIRHLLRDRWGREDYCRDAKPTNEARAEWSLLQLCLARRRKPKGNKSQPFFKNRSIYYVSESIARQGERGSAWNYAIDSVYLVAFLNFSPIDFKKQFRTGARMEGREEGIKEGIKKGKIEGMIENARKMKAYGFALEIIADQRTISSMESPFMLISLF